MIKTHSGKKIAPRVGDVVRNERNQIWTLTEICINNGFIPFYPEAYVIDDCTLMHRLFEVGDEMVLTSNPAKNRIPKDEPAIAFILSFGPCHHKDEALRDHPDYRAEDA